MNQMDKINFVLYVNLMNKYEKQASEGTTMIFSSDEKNLMKYMREIAKKDVETRKFLNELTDMSPREREEAVEKLFEPSKKTDSFITIDEIRDYKEQIDELSKDEKNKLNYIINNYKKFNVKGIYLDPVKFIDSDDIEREVTFDKKTNQYTVKGLKIEPEIEEEVNEPVRETRYSRLEEPIKEKLIKDEPEKKKINKEPKKSNKKGIIGAILIFLFTAFAGCMIATVVSLILSK